MKKKFENKGNTAEIVIKKNYSTKVISSRNPSSLETERKRVYISQVTAYVNSSVLETVFELQTEQEIEAACTLLEEKVEAKLKELATAPQPTFEQRMKEKGYE